MKKIHSEATGVPSCTFSDRVWQNSLVFLFFNIYETNVLMFLNIYVLLFYFDTFYASYASATMASFRLTHENILRLNFYMI